MQVVLQLKNILIIVKTLTYLFYKEQISRWHIPFAGHTTLFKIIIEMGRFPDLIIRVYNEYAKHILDVLDSIANSLIIIKMHSCEGHKT